MTKMETSGAGSLANAERMTTAPAGIAQRRFIDRIFDLAA